jgi:hypothetical protein
MIISSSYTYYDDIGPPQTYMNISYPTSNWMTWEIIRYNYILLYVVIIMNRCIVSLIFNKMLYYLNH